MTPTERHREFIAELQADCTRLGKPQMMRVTWLAPANQTRLARNKFQVGLVAQIALRPKRLKYAGRGSVRRAGDRFIGLPSLVRRDA